jgi:hypothetical protein
MAAQWPLVVDRLLYLLPTLPGWNVVSVFDGALYDNANAVYCTVGHAFDGVSATAGSYTSTQTADGFQRLEAGTVVGELVSTDSDPEQPTDRGVVFDLMDAFETYVRNDRTLGVLSHEGTSDLTVEVNTSQNVPGSSYALRWALNYTTVT